jgi:predicted RNA-binding protein with PIN domain
LLSADSEILSHSVAHEKHLLVDGSNVVRAWPELRALDQRNRDSARSRLGDALRVLHDSGDYRVTLVFDGKGVDSVVEYPYGHDTFARIFTPVQLTADDVIEHLVGQSSQPAQCWVATDDRAERQTVEALGATSLPTSELSEWVVRAQERQRTKVAGLEKKNDQEWRRK